MLEHDRDRAWRFAGRRLHADRHAEIGGDRQVDRHLDAAHRPAQHHPLAGELDHAHALVGGAVAGREPQREGERVEPLDTARPGRHGPADCCLTPQDLSPRRVIPVRLAPPEFVPRSLPQTCRKQVGIRLMFLVNPRYQRFAAWSCLTGALPRFVNLSFIARATASIRRRNHLNLHDVLILLDQSALTDLAERLVAAARRAGADAADAVAVRSVSLVGRGARGRGRGIRARRRRRRGAARVRRAARRRWCRPTTSRRDVKRSSPSARSPWRGWRPRIRLPGSPIRRGSRATSRPRSARSGAAVGRACSSSAPGAPKPPRLRSRA